MIDWFLTQFKARGVESILDIGCGIGRHADLFKPFRRYLGIDIVRDYIIRSCEISDLSYVIADAKSLDSIFVPNSFDGVLWYDSLEHLSKEDALVSLEYSRKISNKCVGVFTPLGFLEQTENVWGGDAGDAQVHKSGWEIQDFVDLGFQTIEVIGSCRRGMGLIKIIASIWSH